MDLEHFDPRSEDAHAGGGWRLLTGWAKASLGRRGSRLWRTLNHQSACLSCAWGTGGQKGGFRDELGEPLQQCLKSVEAIQAELQPAVPSKVFERCSLTELQELDSAACDRLGRLDRPLVRHPGSDHYEPTTWDASTTPLRQLLRRQSLTALLPTAQDAPPMKRPTCFS